MQLDVEIMQNSAPSIFALAGSGRTPAFLSFGFYFPLFFHDGAGDISSHRLVQKMIQIHKIVYITESILLRIKKTPCLFPQVFIYLNNAGVFF